MITSLPTVKMDCKPRKLVPKFLQEKIRQIRTKKANLSLRLQSFFLLRFSNQLKLKTFTKTFQLNSNLN